MQLTFEDARRRRGPRLSVLPDAARVEAHLARLARAQGGLAAFKVACSAGELERELAAGQRIAPPEAILLAVHEAGGSPSLAWALAEGRELPGSPGRTLSAARA